MSIWFAWYVARSLVHNPLGALVLLLVGLWLLEHYTFGTLPTPVRWYRRFKHRARLRRRIEMNAHDRKARFELADLLLDMGAAKDALPLVKANVEAGDTDAQTLFLLGKACLRAGRVAEGETVMAAALEADPKVRHGEAWIELGRARLSVKQFAAAREALETFRKERQGTVEGRVLLARALAGEGNAEAAAAMRAEAWKEYALSPRYVRRQERLWAWRVRPSRPVAYAALALVLAGLVGYALAQAQPFSTHRPASAPTAEVPEDDEP